MYNTIKIAGELRPVNTLTQLIYGRHLCEHVVAENGTRYASGFRLPAADAYAKRIADEAEQWLAFARERSRMQDETLVRKALGSVAFSLRHHAHDLAVPTKISGTSQHQGALWRMVRERTPLGTRLDVREDGKRLTVLFEGDELGEIQGKHAPWIRPLLRFNAGIYLVRVTGSESRGYRLGANIAVGRAGKAVAALQHALGHVVGGDGYGGEEAAETVLRVSSATSSETVLVPVFPESDALGGDASDVILWRDTDGVARSSVEHVVRHSPTGIEWSYAGSGPADLARSVLLSFASEAEAEALYQSFKTEVIATVPQVGGVLKAEDIRRWLAAHAEPGGDGMA